MKKHPDLTPEQIASAKEQMRDLLPAILDTLILSGHSLTACAAALMETTATLTGWLGGDPDERLLVMLPAMQHTANQAYAARQLTEGMPLDYARDLFMKGMPKNERDQFRARLSLWVLEELGKGRVI